MIKKGIGKVETGRCELPSGNFLIELFLFEWETRKRDV